MNLATLDAESVTLDLKKTTAAVTRLAVLAADVQTELRRQRHLMETAVFSKQGKQDAWRREQELWLLARDTKASADNARKALAKYEKFAPLLVVQETVMRELQGQLRALPGVKAAHLDPDTEVKPVAARTKEQEREVAELRHAIRQLTNGVPTDPDFPEYPGISGRLERALQQHIPPSWDGPRHVWRAFPGPLPETRKRVQALVTDLRNRVRAVTGYERTWRRLMEAAAEVEATS